MNRPKPKHAHHNQSMNASDAPRNIVVGDRRRTGEACRCRHAWGWCHTGRRRLNGGSQLQQQLAHTRCTAPTVNLNRVVQSAHHGHSETTGCGRLAVVIDVHLNTPTQQLFNATQQPHNNAQSSPKRRTSVKSDSEAPDCGYEYTPNNVSKLEPSVVTRNDPLLVARQ